MKKHTTFSLLFFAWAAFGVFSAVYESTADKVKVEYTVVQKMPPSGTKSGSQYEIVLRDTHGNMTEKTTAASIYVQAKEGEKIYFYEIKNQLPILIIWFFSTMLFLAYLLVDMFGDIEKDLDAKK